MKTQLNGQCPYCEADIEKEIDRYFFGQLPGEYFEFECPECNVIMDVEVQGVPEFYTSKQEK